MEDENRRLRAALGALGRLPAVGSSGPAHLPSRALSPPPAQRHGSGTAAQGGASSHAIFDRARATSRAMGLEDSGAEEDSSEEDEEDGGRGGHRDSAVMLRARARLAARGYGTGSGSGLLSPGRGGHHLSGLPSQATISRTAARAAGLGMGSGR